MEETHTRRPSSGVRRIWWFPPLPAGAKVCEIGSGEGHFVRAAKARGWIVEHFDPMTGGPTAERWASLVPWTLPEPNHYDVIFAWQVLEHLHDPWTVARAVRRGLHPDGYFVLSIPSRRSLEAWLMGDRWEARHPGHLSEWSPRTIRGFLEACGFHRVRILHQRIVKHVRGPWWFTLALGCVVAALRISSRITVVARP